MTFETSLPSWILTHVGFPCGLDKKQTSKLTPSHKKQLPQEKRKSHFGFHHIKVLFRSIPTSGARLFKSSPIPLIIPVVPNHALAPPQRHLSLDLIPPPSPSHHRNARKALHDPVRRARNRSRENLRFGRAVHFETA